MPGRSIGLRKALLGAFVACLALALLPSAASASFHLMKIREVSGGNSGAGFNDSYVELQMYAAGQNLVGGHTLNVWGHTDTTPTPTTFSANVANGQNQATILIGDTGAPGDAGATNSALSTIQTSGGGLICWENIDCVLIGTGPAAGVSPPSPVGAAAPFPFTGEAIRRTITRGCATALDTPDDTNSGTDFSKTTPLPRNNSAPITEKLCAGSGGTTPPPGSNFKCGGKPATLIGTSGKDDIKGTNKPDVIVTFGGNDKVSGRGGNDFLCGTAGKDSLIGGKGQDFLIGGAGRDTLLGGAGRDTLRGQKGNDVCNGGPGSDVESSCGQAAGSASGPSGPSGPVY